MTLMVNTFRRIQAADVPNVFHAQSNIDKSIGESNSYVVGGQRGCLPAKDETLVIVKIDKSTAFVGRLVDINQEFILFDYVVLDSNLEGYMDSLCEVNLKRGYNPGIYSESFHCRIVNDAYIQYGSFFDIPMRRCSLGFIRQLSLSEMQSFL
jgi:hypothetical protein